MIVHILPFLIAACSIWLGLNIELSRHWIAYLFLFAVPAIALTVFALMIIRKLKPRSSTKRDSTSANPDHERPSP